MVNLHKAGMMLHAGRTMEAWAAKLSEELTFPDSCTGGLRYAHLPG
jgi:hypothetical protein